MASTAKSPGSKEPGETREPRPEPPDGEVRAKRDADIQEIAPEDPPTAPILLVPSRRLPPSEPPPPLDAPPDPDFAAAPPVPGPPSGPGPAPTSMFPAAIRASARKVRQRIAGEGGRGMRALRISVLLVFVLLGVAIAVTQTRWGEEKIKNAAIDAIRSELGLEATLGDVDVRVHVWPPGLELHASDIVLDHPEHGTLAEASSLRIAPSLFALITGRIDLDEIDLVEPQVHLVIEDGRIVNLPTLPESSGGETEIPFRRLEVLGAAVTVDAYPFLTGNLRDVDATLDVDDRVITVELGAHGGTLSHAKGEDELARLELRGDIDLDAEVATVEELALDFGVVTPRAPDAYAEEEHGYARTEEGQPRVHLVVRSASVPFSVGQPWHGHVEARVDLEQLERLPTALELPMLRGVVNVDAELHGAGLVIPSGQGTLRADDVWIADGKGLGDVLEIHFELADEVVTILPESRGQLSRDGGDIGLSGTLALDEDRGYPVELHADIRSFQMTHLFHQLGVTPNSIVWWPMVGEGHLRGTLSPFAIEGPLRTTARDFLVTLGAWDERPRRRIIGVEQGRIAGRWRFDEEAASFFDLTLDTARSHVEVPMVRIEYDNDLLVQAKSERLDLRDISPLTSFELAGVAKVDVRVGGTLLAPVVTGHAAVADMAFDTFPLGDVEGDFQIRDDYMGVYSPSLRAEKDQSRYRVDDFMLDFSQGYIELTGMMHAQRVSLQDLYHVFHYENDERWQPYQGWARGQASLRFTFGAPWDGPNGTFETNLQLELLSANFAGIHYDHGQFAGHFLWRDFTQGLDGGELRIDEFQLSKGAGNILIAGDIAPPRAAGNRVGMEAYAGPAQLRLSVSADQIQMRETEILVEDMPELDGIYSFLGEVRGTPSVPRMHLDVAMTGLRWEDTYLGDARTYVRLTDVADPWVRAAREDGFDVDAEPCGHARRGLATGSWPMGPDIMTADGPKPPHETRMAYLICGAGLGGQVDVDLAMGWTHVWPLRGVIDLRGLRLERYLGDFFPDRQLGGVVDGRIALRGGSLSHPERLAGSVNLRQVRIEAANDGGDRFEIAADGPVRIDLRRGGFEIRRASLVGFGGTELRIEGGSDHRGRLDLDVEGSVDLGVLDTLSKSVSSSAGRVAFRVDVEGTMSDPRVFGEAQVRRAQIGLRDAPASIDDLRGTVRFNSRRVLFEDFQAEVAGGRFDLAGAATLQDGGLTQYEFDLALDGAQFRPEEGLDVAISSQAQLAWRQGQRLPQLRGEVVLDRVRFTRNVSLSPTLGQLYRPQREQVQRYDPEADLLELDLRVIDRTPIRVANNLLDVAVRIDDSDRPFRIVGTDQRFGVLGSLRIPRGTVSFRGTELAVTRGAIRFDDETRVDPHFDVLTETEIRRQQTTADLTAPAWRIQVRAHGSMDAFRLDATSQPALSQEDLMLLLTVGMTSAEAQQLQAGDVGGTALEALSALAGVNEEVTEAIGVIDDFAITTRYSPTTGRPEPMVTIGKRISDRVRLSASTGLTGAERTFQTGVEWQVGDQTSFQVGYDNINRETSSSFGNVGVDFRWRLEFE